MTRSSTSAREAPPRLGPRPLPLHLTLAATTWGSSRAALPMLRSGSLPWRPELRAGAAALEASLAGVPADAFAAAVEGAVYRRLSALLDGILAYRRHPARRSLAEPPAIWQEGSTRLLDYGERAGGAPVLMVPSLVNRAYILDLTERQSLARHLARAGLRPLLLDWGAPGPDERRFDLTDYIARRLDAALDAALAAGGRPPVLVGYCMGGLLALALALRRQRDIAALALLATPWDFHAENAAQAKAAAAAGAAMLPVFERLGEMPVDALQAMFAALDPFSAVRKFVAFANLRPDGEKAAAFVALEDWVNDGVALTPGVARDCLVGWYGENEPARGSWLVAGEPVVPEELDRPALVVIPARDRIVPPSSAMALADALPAADRMAPTAGHIGMVVGSAARAQVWEPLADWIAGVAPKARARSRARSGA